MSKQYYELFPGFQYSIHSKNKREETRGPSSPTLCKYYVVWKAPKLGRGRKKEQYIHRKELTILWRPGNTSLPSGHSTIILAAEVAS